MKYNIKEYSCILDTRVKKMQELLIAQKIVELLNTNKVNNIEQFNKEVLSLKDFIEKYNLIKSIKCLGNSINEEDFMFIKENFLNLSKRKESVDLENVVTLSSDDKEYNSYKGENKTFYINNTNSNKKIEEQINDLKRTSTDYNTPSKEKNTENIFYELENRKKETINPINIYQIDENKLNYEQQELLNIIKINYKDKNNIKVDLNNNIIIDENGNMNSIKKDNYGYQILNSNTNNNLIEKQKKLEYKNNSNYRSKENS